MQKRKKNCGKLHSAAFVLSQHDLIANPERRTPLPKLAEAETIAQEVPPGRKVQGDRDLVL